MYCKFCRYVSLVDDHYFCRAFDSDMHLLEVQPEHKCKEYRSIFYAQVHWTIEDVISIFKLTEEQATDFLMRSQDKIIDAMVREGWHTITTLLLEEFGNKEVNK